MPKRSPGRCTNCRAIIDGRGLCGTCQGTVDKQRGTARERGYDSEHERRFRAVVLQREPRCQCPDDDHGHGRPCLRKASIADHYPRSRRQLVDAGLDPNDPQYGRGLCTSCHSRHTNRAQPGGWNRR